MPKWKHKRYFREKVPFKDDIGKVLCFSFLGFDCFKITPMIFSVPGRYFGIDFYLSGEFNGKRNFLICYSKLGPKKYKLVRICELDGKSETSLAETNMVAKYFENNYLRKKCRFTIE